MEEDRGRRSSSLGLSFSLTQFDFSLPHSEYIHECTIDNSGARVHLNKVNPCWPVRAPREKKTQNDGRGEPRRGVFLEGLLEEEGCDEERGQEEAGEEEEEG